MHKRQIGRSIGVSCLIVGFLSLAGLPGCERDQSGTRISTEEIEKGIVGRGVEIESCYSKTLTFTTNDKTEITILESKYESQQAAILVNAKTESYDAAAFCYKCVFRGQLRLHYDKIPVDGGSRWQLYMIENVSFKPLGRENERPPESSTLPTRIFAPTPETMITPIRVSGWNGFTPRTLCLRVEQSYPKPTQKSQKGVGNIAERSKDILIHMGFDVVQSGQPCEATLSFKTSGEALSSDYKYTALAETVRCFNGAEVSGTVLLESVGKPPITITSKKKRISGAVEASCPREAAGAPFDALWKYTLYKGVIHLWGARPLVNLVKTEATTDNGIPISISESEPGLWALRESDADATSEIVDQLGSGTVMARQQVLQMLLGNDNAVPVLIEALAADNGLVRDCAECALKYITKQDWGRDHLRWSQWLETKK